MIGVLIIHVPPCSHPIDVPKAKVVLAVWLRRVQSHQPGSEADIQSIESHGVRQVRSGWSDGPSYITKCPIQSGQSYVYNLSMVGQKRNSILARKPLVVKGSSAWTPRHPHEAQRILPVCQTLQGNRHPLWRVVECGSGGCDCTSISHRGGPNVSDAYTINGLPEPLYNTTQLY
ncbi:Laccase-17 [Glycine soja]|nr:Laccase-17 [Glycine soja]